MFLALYTMEIWALLAAKNMILWDYNCHTFRIGSQILWRKNFSQHLNQWHFIQIQAATCSTTILGGSYNWVSRNSLIVVYFTCGYSFIPSTPPEDSMSKYVWSPFTKAEYMKVIFMLRGYGVSAKVNHKVMAKTPDKKLKETQCKHKNNSSKWATTILEPNRTLEIAPSFCPLETKQTKEV